LPGFGHGRHTRTTIDHTLDPAVHILHIYCMSFRYQVRTYTWVNGAIQSVSWLFDSERAAMAHARSMNPSEVVKVYVEDEVIYVQPPTPTPTPDQTPYA
jgi:hypothetical protein